MNLTEIDVLLFSLINRDIQNGFLDVLMPLVTQRAWIFFLPAFLWYFFRDKKRATLAVILGVAALLLADWTSNSLKYYFARPRPCAALDGVRLLVGCGKSFSMPSNHAVNAFAFATPFIVLRTTAFRYLFLAVALLVAFSRVYVGVHYPSDVIIGALVGTLVSGMVILSFRLVSREFRGRPYPTALTVFLVCVGLFRLYYILNGPLDLSPDEAHYWEWSRRLDLSYYSKGPMIAYLIRLGTILFGDTVLGVRIMAVFLSTLSSIVLYFLARKLYDEKTGLLSAIFIQVIPLFSVYGVIFTIDSPLIFFWILSLLLFRRALSSAHVPGPKGILPWGILGIAVGLGMLSKYSMAFFSVCSLLFLISHRDGRRILLTTGPYAAFVMSIVVFSPVLFWNASHDWVSFRHTAGQAHIGEGVRLSLTSFLEFVGSQFGVITPLLLVLMAIALVRLRRTDEGKFLFWFSFPVMGFFVLKSIQAKVQANWALPAYVTPIVAYAAYSLRTGPGRVRRWKRLAVIALVMAIAVTSLAHYPAILDLPVHLNPASRLMGWRELGEEVTVWYERLSLERPVFVFSDRYQVSSQLAFYVKGRPITYCIPIDRRMNQYDIWPSFDSLIHHHAVFVRIGDVPIPQQVAEAFEKVEKKVFTAYTKRHAKIRDYSIFLCYDFKGLARENPKTF